MKKIFGGKRIILILGGCTLLVMVALIASLGSLELKPAVPFAYLQQTSQSEPITPPNINIFILIIIFLVAVLAFIFFVLPVDQRKKFLLALGGLIVAGFIIFIILSRVGVGKAVQQPDEGNGQVLITPLPEPSQTLAPLVTPSVFNPPKESPLIAYLVALVILLFIGGAIILWTRARLRDEAPFDQLAQIAQSGLDDMEDGKDWGDVVLGSYYRMNKAVAAWRGIRRQAGMTPAEFSDQLISANLPREAVERLTTLFSKVRYGDKRSNRADIDETVACLRAILDVCQEAK